MIRSKYILIVLLTWFRISLLVFLFTSCSKSKILEVDICVYGGTSSGVIAACAADRLGKSTILITPEKHLGGLSSGGLGQTDIGNKFAITGMSRDFYRQVGKHYGEPEKWTFEPHVAEGIFNSMLSGRKLLQLREFRIISALKAGTTVREILVESARKGLFKQKFVVRAKIFIDCSYEGDLMAKSGISYTIGREANSMYGETLNGVELRDKHQFPDSIDPYIEKGNLKSGLVWGISQDSIHINGTGDKKVQAYNYRLCLTKNRNNFLPFRKPADYNSSHYELLRRLIEKDLIRGKDMNLSNYMHIQDMPMGKTDINNNGPFSTDYINESWNYPDADYDERDKIRTRHINYIRGFLYFLGHDAGVPEKLRDQMLQWGYVKDEFADNQGFPYQIYVRESRRMIGEYVMTEKNCTGQAMTKDGIGMAAYTMDSHNCQRIVRNGMVKNEGDVQVGGFPPYEISYFAITPKKAECTNVLVPVCLSSSHIAYGSIRMEPVFMVLGQSAAIAAASAIDFRCKVQEVDVKEIQNKLIDDPLLNGTHPGFTQTNEESNRSRNKIILELNLGNKLNPGYIRENHGLYYSLNLALKNNTDSLFEFWIFNCYWQFNWTYEDNSIKLWSPPCDRNFPVTRRINPGEELTFNGILEVLDSSNLNDKMNRLGFILIRKDENSLGKGYYSEVLNKIKLRKDIIWSEAFKIDQ